MSSKLLAAVARELVTRLAQGEYEWVLHQCAQSRLTCDDLGRVIGEYGRKLVPPPDEFADCLDAIRVSGTESATWSVHVPLWTEEEGRSDLTLQVTITLGSGKPVVELDDLHVL